VTVGATGQACEHRVRPGIHLWLRDRYSPIDPVSDGRAIRGRQQHRLIPGRDEIQLPGSETTNQLWIVVLQMIKECHIRPHAGCRLILIRPDRGQLFTQLVQVALGRYKDRSHADCEPGNHK